MPDRQQDLIDAANEAALWMASMFASLVKAGQLANNGPADRALNRLRRAVQLATEERQEAAASAK